MAKFLVFLPLLLQLEKGYQADPEDKGNKNSLGQIVGTNRGVSARVYEHWIGRPPTVADMKAITPETAKAIFKAWYWDKVRASEIKSQDVADIVVDHAVNSGVEKAVEILQQTLNDSFNTSLETDGVMGSKTLTAVNEANWEKLYVAYLDARERYYKSTQNSHFLQGWLKRLLPFKERLINFESRSRTYNGHVILGGTALLITLFF